MYRQMNHAINMPNTDNDLLDFERFACVAYLFYFIDRIKVIVSWPVSLLKQRIDWEHCS